MYLVQKFPSFLCITPFISLSYQIVMNESGFETQKQGMFGSSQKFILLYYVHSKGKKTLHILQNTYRNIWIKVIKQKPKYTALVNANAYVYTYAQDTRRKPVWIYSNSATQLNFNVNASLKFTITSTVPLC